VLSKFRQKTNRNTRCLLIPLFVALEIQNKLFLMIKTLCFFFEKKRERREKKREREKRQRVCVFKMFFLWCLFCFFFFVLFCSRLEREDGIEFRPLIFINSDKKSDRGDKKKQKKRKVMRFTAKNTQVALFPFSLTQLCIHFISFRLHIINCFLSSCSLKSRAVKPFFTTTTQQKRRLKE
jgi:hypothetical protein